MYRRMIGLAAVALAAMTVAACGTAPDRSTGDPGPVVSESAVPTSAAAAASAAPTASAALFSPGKVTLTVKGYWSWAYLDWKTGQAAGSTPYSTSDTASMSKAWIAADYLRRAGEKKQTPSAATMSELSRMIRDSETENAFKYHVANGNLASIQRMIKMCRLTETKGIQNSWSLTQMSARDVTRLAKCIGTGVAAGPTWTAWLLTEMRNVRGPGRFGIIEALPANVAQATAIKNGWLDRDDGQWHIACMAVGDSWSIGVMAHYTATLGKDYGARICRDVTSQLLTHH